MEQDNIKLLPLEDLINALEEKGIEYDRGDIANAYFPLKDVKVCMNSEVEVSEMMHSRSCPLCGKPSKELKWIYFRSPEWTWKNLCGWAGPLSICPDCGCLVEFIMHMMS